MHGYLRHLANFAYVVEAGSITAAANRLGSSPSSISDSVKLLEAHLGETLLERRKTGVIPTGRGLKIFEDAQDIVAALDRALGADDQETSATLRISVPAELAQGWFDEGLRAIQAKHPELNLILMVEDALVDHTKYARDIHIRAGRKESRPGLQDLSQHQTQAAMVAATRICTGIDPNSAKDVQSMPFVGKPRTTRTVSISLPNGEQIAFENTLFASAVTTRISMMRAGLGVTTCLRPSVAEGIGRGELTELCSDQFKFPVAISIASPHRRPPKPVQIVAEAIGAALESSVQRG